MSVNSYLNDLASALVLSPTEKRHVSTSVETIKTRLNLYFSTEVEEKKVFGSYVRGTILPRTADEKSDVDIMVVLKNPYGHKPQTFLNKLRKFAEKYYSSSEIYQSSPTIVLELNHIKFELTPAYIQYGIYYIPNGQSNWMHTNPDGFYSTLTQCNSNNLYKIKPAVRLLKYWNIVKNNRNMSSFSLEKKIAEEMTYAYITCTSYTDYLKKALNLMKYNTNTDKINLAIGYIDVALAYEEKNMPYSALAAIKKVFPEV